MDLVCFQFSFEIQRKSQIVKSGMYNNFQFSFEIQHRFILSWRKICLKRKPFNSLLRFIVCLRCCSEVLGMRKLSILIWDSSCTYGRLHTLALFLSILFWDSSLGITLYFYYKGGQRLSILFWDSSGQYFGVSRYYVITLSILFWDSSAERFDTKTKGGASFNSLLRFIYIYCWGNSTIYIKTFNSHLRFIQGTWENCRKVGQICLSILFWDSSLLVKFSTFQ